MFTAAPAAMFTKAGRKAATIWARGSNLEGRSKFGWGTAKRIAQMAPQFSHLSNRFEELVNGLHKAEGQHLDYDKLKDARIRLESRFKNMDAETENVLNAKLGGSKVEWPANSTIPHAELDQLFDILEKNNVYANKLENDEFARVGLGSPDNPDVSREEHPRFMSGTSRNPINTARNLASILPGVRRPGMKPSNSGRMAQAISDWLEGNASFDGQKIVWREGKGRDWWKSDDGGTHSVRIGDIELNPDNITTQAQFDAWKALEPARLTKALLKSSSMLDKENQALDKGLERALKLPHLGAVIHNVSVIDMIRGMERRTRNLNAIKALPDGFFEKLEKLRADVSTDVRELEGIRDASGGIPESKKAAAGELAELLRMLESSIGIRQKGSVGSLTGDAMEIIGRPQFDDVGGLAQAALDADAQLADYMNKVFIKYNLSSGIRQEGQSLMAAIASGDASGIANYSLSRAKTMPPVALGMRLAGKEAPKVRQNTHVIPSKDDNALLVGLSKLREQMRLQSNSTEQIEAATIDGFMNSLRGKIASPSKPLAEYLDRVIGRSGADELRAAFAAGDLESAFEIARPLIIRELDQKNGSGLSSSKPAAMKASTLTRLGSRLVSTPLTVTGSILGAKDRYGAQASQYPLASKALALGILGGGQLLSNAMLVSDKRIAAPIALATGSYLPAAWYAYRDENEEEIRATQKLETIASQLGSAAGGNVGAAARLGMAGLAEAFPLKMSSSADILYGGRSKDAKQLGATAGETRPAAWWDKAGEFLPTTVGVGLLAGDAVKSISDYGPMGVIGPTSPIPLFRSLASSGFMLKDLDMRGAPIEAGVETPNASKIIRDKGNRKMIVTIPE